jgi:hypothetical protein
MTEQQPSTSPETPTPVNENVSGLSPELIQYRNHLVAAEQKSQESYDKAVLSLSGTALGVSFAFIDKFLDLENITSNWLLYSSWTCWGLSITVVLASYFSSQKALRDAINAVDRNEIYDRTAGGLFSTVTDWLNASSGLLFSIGVILMIVFVAFNV